ncbi:FixH family protein [Propionivibrio soli]|uniref:FixH family protein n=1 Tax=Propionivibrio soli TaxID=2976531 RepID=UPI0021E8D9EA|nr:FixH family protein [Propionivibrio soli]
MNERLSTSNQPWYRHRWPWLLMLGPFLVIVAAAVTVFLAVRSNDGLVDDDYYKQGLAVNQLTARDRQAAALGLVAELVFDRQRHMVSASVTRPQGGEAPTALKLTIAHPTRSGFDQSVVLPAVENGRYAAGLTIPDSGRWHLVLEDERRQWRLVGDWLVEDIPQPVVKLAAH